VGNTRPAGYCGLPELPLDGGPQEPALSRRSLGPRLSLPSMKRALLIVLIVAALGLFGWAIVATSDPQEEAGAPIESVDLDQNEDALPPSDTAEVVERILPSVVNVRITSLNFDPFGGQEEAQGQGSGVVLDAEGIIVTNFHVVSEAVEVEVRLADGQSLEGRVVGGVPERDLAVIQVEADDLNPIELGTSENIRLGEDVIAIGFPLGLGGPTVTKGILSAKDRTIQTAENQTFADMLQTDAAINPGNSGGPLVDANGRLIGINSAAAGAATAENVGFAIPIDKALPVIEQILREPAAEQAWIGVQVLDLTEELAADLNVDVTQGAVVAGSFEGSPAAEAGIGEGEVIVAVDGEEITSHNDLIETLGGYAPGDEVEVRIVSPTGERTVTVELAQRPISFSN
jgi:S1-C subfamily serine protease